MYLERAVRMRLLRGMHDSLKWVFNYLHSWLTETQSAPGVKLEWQKMAAQSGKRITTPP